EDRKSGRGVTPTSSLLQFEDTAAMPDPVSYEGGKQLVEGHVVSAAAALASSIRWSESSKGKVVMNYLQNQPPGPAPDHVGRISGARLSSQPEILSSCPASDSSVSSSPGRPTTWMPSGRPFAVTWTGSAIAGCPLTFWMQ